MSNGKKRPSEEGREGCWIRLDEGFSLDSLACLMDPRTETYHFKINGKTYCLLIEKVVFPNGKIIPEFGKHCLLMDHAMWFDDGGLEEAHGATGDLRPVRASRPFTLSYCWDAIRVTVRESLKEAASLKKARQAMNRLGAKALGWLFR